MTSSTLNELSYHPLLAKAIEMESKQETVKELKETNRKLWFALFIVASVGVAF